MQHPLFIPQKSRMHTLYSIGYLNPRALDLLQECVDQGAVILDIRRVAASRYRPNFSGKRLRERFGTAYQRLRELGNDNYNQPGAPIVLHNPDLGISQLFAWLEQHDCCLLCRCQHLAACHSSVVVNLVQQMHPEIHVVRLGERLEPGGKGERDA